ncbi:Nucleolar protein 7, partial [Chaetura pelagica]
RRLRKEKRRRRQELFLEQKKQKLLPQAVLQELSESEAAKQSQGEAAKKQGQAQRPVKKAKGRKGARSEGNYTAVCLKEECVTGLQEQLARDFLSAHLYGPEARRVQANEFFSIENKKKPVKAAAVQFVDKSWGQEKKQKALRFKKRWLSTQLKNQ